LIDSFYVSPAAFLINSQETDMIPQHSMRDTTDWKLVAPRKFDLRFTSNVELNFRISPLVHELVVTLHMFGSAWIERFAISGAVIVPANGVLQVGNDVASITRLRFS
jgi:hypothetical protein